ncbi:MAG TPA: GNAT family N-acetyltransferase [Solirubrobacteraceae bacterium]|nr:GNAT family N-acetyltransferase [Solirubrobacteraceae bacterium]
MDIHALPDGRIVTIRPIQIDDSERLQLSHSRLSEESRYRRFMSTKPVLTAADARYLVNIDGRDHYALVATVAEPEGEAIIGVARYIRLHDRPDVAEFAIVVGDAWQRQGLAAELMGRLADAAVTRGVRRFCATILADNVGIRRVIDQLAAGPVERRRDGNVLEVEFPLPTRPQLAGGVPAMIAACAGS